MKLILTRFMGLFNCSGWSHSGGPWIKLDHSMRHLTSSELRIAGPVKFAKSLGQPTEQFQDLAVLAFPAPKADADSLVAKAPNVTCTPTAAGAEKLVDSDLAKALEFPGQTGHGRNAFTIEIETAQSLTARSLSLYPAENAFAAVVIIDG